MTEPSKKIEQWQQEDAGRLSALFKSKSRLSQAEFGAQYEIGSQGMVWQYLSGRRPLNIKAAGAFARGLGVKIEDFSPEIAKQVVAASKKTGEQPVEPKPWPFDRVDQRKVAALDTGGKARLEAAILIAAAQVGVDIKKTD